MNHWIFVANNNNPFFVNAEDAYRNRMKHGLWGIGPNVRNRHQLQDGDKIVFYLTSPAMTFVGTATISSTDLNKSEQDKIDADRVFSGAKSGVSLTDIDEWSEAKEIKPLIKDLRFIKNKEHWWSHLQTGIVNQKGMTGIPKEDFELITLKPLSN